VTVVAQGVLGGLRVVLLREELALLHGPLAQAFFALVATLVYLTSAAAQTTLTGSDAGLRRLAIVAAVVTYAQIVLGALLTHAGWLSLHLAGALVVFAVLPMLTARARRTGDVVAAPLSRVLLALLGLQAALGVGAYLARFSPIWIPGEQVTMLVLPVLHRLVGGLLLATTVVLAVRLHGISASKDVRSQRERGGTGETAGAHVANGVRSQRERGGMGETAGADVANGVRSQRERGGMGEAEGVPHLK